MGTRMFLLSLLFVALNFAPNCVAARHNDINFVNIDPATVAATQKILEITKNITKSHPAPNNEPLIAYGDIAKYGQFPFMASLQLNYGDEESWPIVNFYGTNYSIPTAYHTCGGTLIWPNLILTAGHCLGNKKHPVIPDFALIGGTIVQANPVNIPVTNAPERFVIDGYVQHPKYNLTDYGATNDVGILRISGLSTQPLVNLSLTTPPKGQILTAVGWGSLPDPSSPEGQTFGSNLLMYTNFTLSSAADIAVPEGYLCPNSPGILCVSTTPVPGTTDEFQSTCSGDSGGPQLIQGTNIQAGLTSFGPEGCGNSTWEAETNVAYYLSSFIAPTVINFGLPNPVKTKSICKTWTVVAIANKVYSLDGSRLIYYTNTTTLNSKACGAACMNDPVCYSFSFSLKTKKCSLSSVRVLAMPLVKQEASVGVTSGYVKCV